MALMAASTLPHWSRLLRYSCVLFVVVVDDGQLYASKQIQPHPSRCTALWYWNFLMAAMTTAGAPSSLACLRICSALPRIVLWFSEQGGPLRIHSASWLKALAT